MLIFGCRHVIACTGQGHSGQTIRGRERTEDGISEASVDSIARGECVCRRDGGGIYWRENRAHKVDGWVLLEDKERTFPARGRPRNPGCGQMDGRRSGVDDVVWTGPRLGRSCRRGRCLFRSRRRWAAMGFDGQRGVRITQLCAELAPISALPPFPSRALQRKRRERREGAR